MFEAVTNTRSRWRTFWPKVNDVAGAEEAIRFATWMAFFVAGLALLGAGLTLLGGDVSGSLNRLVDVALYGLLGLGIRRKWRSVAVFGLVAQIFVALNLATQGMLFIPIHFVALLGFVNGVRGAYALRRLKAEPEPQAV